MPCDMASAKILLCAEKAYNFMIVECVNHFNKNRITPYKTKDNNHTFKLLVYKNGVVLFLLIISL